MNIPIHIWMNNNIKFTPYFAKAVWKTLGHIPDIIFSVLELQCNYCTRNSKTIRVIQEIFAKYHEFYHKENGIQGQKSSKAKDKTSKTNDETEKRELPFTKRKIKSLRYLCRSRKNVF